MGRLPADEPLLTRRPFRTPHHTISDAGMVGGGNPPAPGEISLAHHGVLFLDELPEFHRRSLEVLRQPLEKGEVTIARALRSTTFPARFVLVAAMNPCPCGYLGDPRHACKCSPPIRSSATWAASSGPLLDRIDLHLEVPAVPFQELSAPTPTAPAAPRCASRSTRVRAVQRERFGEDETTLNSRMSTRQLRQALRPGRAGQAAVAAGDGRPGPVGAGARPHPAGGPHHRRPGGQRRASGRSTSIEAIGYRSLDRKLWAK